MGDLTWWAATPMVVFFVILILSFILMAVVTIYNKQVENSRAIETARDQTTLPHTRPLGCTEQYMDMHNSVGNLILVWTMSIRTKVKVTNQVLMQAFNQLAKRHILLTVRIKEQLIEKQKYYEEMSEDSSLDIRVITNDDWQGAYKAELHTNFNSETGPLWRGRVVTLPSYNSTRLEDFNYVVIMSFHHGIVDGLSGTYITGQYVHVLNQVLLGQPIEATQRVSLPPALDDVAMDGGSLNRKDVTGIVKRAIQPIIGRKKLLFLEKNPPRITIDPTVEMKTEVLEFTIEPESLKVLSKMSKEHGAKLHGLFTAVAAQALAKICHHGILRRTSMSIQNAVDVRSRMSSPVSVERMGNLAILMEQCLEIKPLESLLELAAKCSKNLHRAIDNKEYLTSIRILRSSDFMSFLHDIVRIQRVGGRDDSYFYITNVGVVDHYFPQYEQVSVDHVQFLEAAHMYGSLFGHHLLTYRGSLHWFLHYYNHIVDEDLAIQYKDSIKETFRELLQ